MLDSLKQRGYTIRAGVSGFNPSETVRTQGPRGRATKVSIFVKYASWLFIIILASAATQAATAGIPLLHNAGMWMYVMSAIQCLTAGAAMVAFANNRNDILTSLRHYLFGLSILPATGLALIMWITYNTLLANTSSSMAQVLTSALPWGFFITMFIPAAVFIKYVTGLRTLHRTNLDNEEAVSLWTRQSDGLSR